MNNDRLLGIGVVGTVVAAICCVTPVLVLLLGVLGLSAFAGWLDYVLFPALVLCVGIVIYAILKRRSA